MGEREREDYLAGVVYKMEDVQFIDFLFRPIRGDLLTAKYMFSFQIN